VRLLLDTHIAIWSILESQKIPPSVKSLIGDTANEVFVSSCSLWEIAIKSQRGRASSLSIDATMAQKIFARAGFEVLDIRVEHILAIERLPLLHRDPFDRLIIAQALVEPLRLVTHDAAVARYSDTIIRC
jgi:PIN domain nuclease of toxin-antitoxin system